MFKDFSRKYLSPFTLFCEIAFIFSMLLLLFATVFERFADFINRYVSHYIRSLFAYLTAWIPFSLAEAIILMAIPLAVIYIVYCVAVLSKKGRLLRHIFHLLAVILLVISLFNLSFGIAYHCTPVEERLGMETGNLTVNDVYTASEKVLEEIKAIESKIGRDENGSAVMPYSYKEMNNRIARAYCDLSEELPFLPKMYVGTKKIVLSKPMTYTYIMGVYTFFTGEANVNTNQSDYSLTFTAAHEMAHQRGIAPEDEANFVAFLALYNSGDPYLKYCCLTEVFNHMANAVYAEDEELYLNLLKSFSPEIVDEYVADYDKMDEYKGIVSDMSDAINDAYLKLQGQKEGTKSYGLVTDLATAFFLNKQ